MQNKVALRESHDTWCALCSSHPQPLHGVSGDVCLKNHVLTLTCSFVFTSLCLWFRLWFVYFEFFKVYLLGLEAVVAQRLIIRATVGDSILYRRNILFLFSRSSNKTKNNKTTLSSSNIRLKMGNGVSQHRVFSPSPAIYVIQREAKKKQKSLTY